MDYAPIERLPRELKLEILSLLDYISLFNLCDAIETFRQVYNAYQTQIRSPHHSPEVIQLLDRFRPVTGMSSTSIAIFANFHSWVTYGGTFRQFLSASELEEKRTRFSARTGIVASMDEARFVVQLEEYASFLYSEAKKYGYRDRYGNYSWIKNTGLSEVRWRWGLKTLAVPEGYVEVPEHRAAREKAIWQFLIATTYYLDRREFLQEERVITPMLQLERWLAVTKEKAKKHRNITNPRMLYDNSYIDTLPVADLATVISVATPIVQCLYLPPVQRASYENTFGHLRSLTTFLDTKCKLAVDNPVLTETIAGIEWLSSTVEVPFEKGTDTGAWRPDYWEMRKDFADRFHRGAVENWPAIRPQFYEKVQDRRRRITCLPEGLHYGDLVDNESYMLILKSSLYQNNSIGDGVV
ncbi:hypothetical protein BJ508DRAFT_323060 [Ascobolus immersus RN42]|uniref:F-box domain-containing protein n=1 Tax=Ascobolus immersus RN42 TaxID=1160509 RepID=A0A3N4IHG5_ASCIM|nr:hypothetical protein BJ508DRAFT_323060 [Ascobolus immersus RN42]